MRIYDIELFANIMDELTKGNMTVDPESWIKDKRNIILQDELDNVAIFEHINDGVVTGHYYFKSRGKEALQAARNFLDEIFSECYNIQVIKGITPLTKLGARWLSRKLGFQSHGIVWAKEHPYELFILTKKEYNK